MATNIFEYATRHKIRFASPRGELSIEQLWDVPLRSTDGFNLDAVAKSANKALKDISEESFVETAKTTAHSRVGLVLDVVKRVIDVKLADEEAALTRAANKVKKGKLIEILSEKQAGKLSQLSEKELQRQLDELGE